MKALTFAQEFALIALNAQDSLHMTTVKKIAVRCMAAAAILEWAMAEDGLQSEFSTVSKQDVENAAAFPHRQEVFRALLKKKGAVQMPLPELLARVTHFSRRTLKKIEHAFSDPLKGMDALEEIPNLLGCDMDYDSASVTMREYRSDPATYTRLTEGMRADVLEDGEMADETVMLLWLLRESSCIYDFFSKEERKRVGQRMAELHRANRLAKMLFAVDIHSSLEIAVKNFLRSKKEVMETPTGIGLDFVFPFLERSQSVFIDIEAWFENKEQRLQDVEARLTKYGHQYTVLRRGAVPLIQIDNVLYEAVPTIRQLKVPVQGMRLRKYPL